MVMTDVEQIQVTQAPLRSFTIGVYCAHVTLYDGRSVQVGPLQSDGETRTIEMKCCAGDNYDGRLALVPASMVRAHCSCTVFDIGPMKLGR